MKFDDIKDRLIILDYIPGSHGSFLTRVLHGLIYNQKNLARVNDNNFHVDSRIPLPPDINLTEFGQSELDSIYIDNPETKPIICPIHWSLQIVSDNKATPEYIDTAKDYQFIELYFSYESTLRYFLSWCFNVGRMSREQMFDLDYFTKHFYQHCLDVSLSKLFEAKGEFKIDNPAAHNYTIEDIVRLTEQWYQVLYDDFYITKIGKRCLPQLDLPQVRCVIEVQELYNLDSFIAVIERIRSAFNLDFELDTDYLTKEWQGLVSIQITDRLLDFTVPDSELHPFELGCRNVYRKQQNVYL